MANYPTPSQSGPQYATYTKHAKRWQDATLISEYEDKGVDTNTSAADVPQRWTFTYEFATETEAKVLDDFWDTHKLNVTFTLIEPRNIPWTGTAGSTVTGVKFEDYEDGGHAENITIQKRVAHLIKYPS
jgi:hypothetical protein